MACLCGHRGFAGPSACVLEKGHEGDHKYGDYQQALAIAAAKELKTLRDQLAASKQREAELVAHVERLRRLLTKWAFTHSDDECVHMEVQEALAATPAQSLARLRNEMVDKCCSIVFGQCENDNVAQRTVNAIRELKELN